MIKNDEILTSFEKGLLTDRAICTDAIASKNFTFELPGKCEGYFLQLPLAPNGRNEFVKFLAGNFDV